MINFPQTLSDTLIHLSKKELSSTELTKACLQSIKKHDPSLNAFITVSEDQALSDAAKADKALANNEMKPLLGIPIALKDIYVTKNIKTTAASNLLKDYVPQYDGTAVTRLKEAGAVIIGKTNCDAWAHGSSGENSDFGPTKNPYNINYVPGGSSSGSPVAVAADMALAASGTDTGGSIRLPASFCNVVGLKPTYGRVSRYGIISMASSLDSIGHFTKTVEDNARYLSVTAGQDPKDGTTPNREVPDYVASIKKGVKGLKIGKPKEYFVEGVDREIRENIESVLSEYERLGAEIVDISLPHTPYAIEVYYIVQTAEVSSNLARFDGVRFGNTRDAFSDEAKRRIMLGTYVLSAGYYDAYYKKAMKVRTLLIEDFTKAFKNVDVILTPTSPTPPWKLGEKVNDPLSMYLSDLFTVHANLVGIPGLSVPTGFVNGLPVGMQLLGPHFSEDLLYQTAYAYETEHPWWKEKPNL